MATFKNDDGTGMIHSAAAATDVVIGTKVIGDAYNRFQVTAAGTISIGNGAAAPTSHASEVLNVRHRVTTGEINAVNGHIVVPAVTGYKIRLVDAAAIAYGGAVTATTTVDLLGIQGTSSVKLVAFGQAALTQSAVVHAGDAAGVVLADGASFVACDAGGAITAYITGDNVATATGVDFIISYVLEA